MKAPTIWCSLALWTGEGVEQDLAESAKFFKIRSLGTFGMAFNSAIVSEFNKILLKRQDLSKCRPISAIRRVGMTMVVAFTMVWEFNRI
jgi:hypothetical protein